MATVLLGRALDTSLPAEYRRLTMIGGRPELNRLRAMHELRGVLEQLERVDVVLALRQGASFEDIGYALGMSRSAAHRKHGGPLPPRS